MMDFQATGEALSPQKRTSRLQNMKFLNFFLLLWFIFVLLDPDLDSETGSGCSDLIESGPNPDPRHCHRVHSRKFYFYYGLIYPILAPSVYSRLHL